MGQHHALDMLATCVHAAWSTLCYDAINCCLAEQPYCLAWPKPHAHIWLAITKPEPGNTSAVQAHDPVLQYKIDHD